MSDFDLHTLDDVIHGKLRLAIMAYLSGVRDASFAEVKAQIGATDGNLSAQTRKLEDAGYLQVTKTFIGRKPHTRLSLTELGRKAWSAYLAQLQQLIESHQGG